MRRAQCGTGQQWPNEAAAREFRWCCRRLTLARRRDLITVLRASRRIRPAGDEQAELARRPRLALALSENGPGRTDDFNALKSGAETRRRVVVAMSGGVDSSVVAALLRRAGHDVIGITCNSTTTARRRAARAAAARGRTSTMRGALPQRSASPTTCSITRHASPPPSWASSPTATRPARRPCRASPATSRSSSAISCRRRASSARTCSRPGTTSSGATGSAAPSSTAPSMPSATRAISCSPRHARSWREPLVSHRRPAQGGGARARARARPARRRQGR